MDKQFTHRYEIWTAATKDQPWPVRPQPGIRPNQQQLPQQQPPQQRQQPRKHIAHAKPANKVDDLGTTMLLYGYGLPIELALEGIATLPNGQSAKCKTTKISADSVDVVYADGYLSEDHQNLAAGTAVSLELEDLGALRGILTAQNREGFQVAVDSAYKNVLGAKLNHLAVQRGLTPPEPAAEVPSDARIELTNKDCWFLDHTSTLRKGTVVNISQIDVLVRATIIPPMGAQIVFRGAQRYSGEVTSIFAIGFMVKFRTHIPSRDFSAAIKFADI